MTLQEESRLSFYKKIAEISSHKNVVLVQHSETRQVFVRKDLTVYDKEVYLYLQKHPSRFFPKIYECVESDGMLTLVEEYIQGQNLEEYLEEKGTLPEAKVTAFTEEICNALKLMHEQPTPMIHRDLKPSNILLDKDLQLKIADFDTARNFDNEKSGDTMVMGTHHYAAPEQYGYTQSDARTDIYALGVMMNYLLTGKYPFEELAEGKLKPVIRKCIRFDPSERYQNVAELQEDLQREKPIGAAAGQKKRHPFLPPGFRTCCLWKMILAAIGYALIWFFGLTMEVDIAADTPMAGLYLWGERVGLIIIGMLWVFFWFNYMDIHRALPLTRSKKRARKWIGYILYTVVIAFLVVLALAMTESFLER